jgi:chromosome segregation ATPase
MTMSRLVFASLILAFISLPGSVRAADQDARAQQAMRNMTTRLRAAETERDSLQAAKAQNDQEKKTLTEKLEAVTKQAAADSTELTAAKTKLAERETENAQLQDSLQKLQLTQTHAVEIAQKAESERVKLGGQVIELQRKLADRETKNLALFKLANEILKRYERFGLGDALAAKEPFTGIARVKLENLVQDYQDKVADQRVKH